MVLTNANTVLASPSNAVLTILNTAQAPGNLFFTATNYSANSSAGYAYITVGRTNGTTGHVSATYTLVAGTAEPGVNYVLNATNNSVSFDDGVSTATIAVQLINNSLAQSAVSLTVFLSNPTNGASLIAPTNATVVINNTNTVFSFTLATNTVSEDQGAASIVVERWNNTSAPASVSYATTSGTAVAGINFSNTTGTLHFGVGEMFQSISIPLYNRAETTNLLFGVSLSGPSGAQLITPSNTVVILEGSAAGLSFTTNSSLVAKNGNSFVTTVVCSNPRVETTTNNVPLQVNYTTVDGTAKAGINYNAKSGILIFTNGLASTNITISIINNQLVSSNLTFSIILTNVTEPGQITPYGTQAVVIAESNAGMSFSRSDYPVFKNNGLAAITVIRTGFTDSVASVNYSVTNDTAIAGQNFYPTNGTLIFTNGVTSQTFDVALIANTQIQPNLVALLSLSQATNSQIVSPGAATLTILETGGSYVIPAGAQLTANSSAMDLANNVIGSNDTVSVLFAFRAAAGLNVTNLTAVLLATNGVASPSPASQTYQNLAVYGHSVSQTYSFTAHGTNGLTIAPTFQLTADGKSAGMASFLFTLGTWTTVFANTNPIVINDDAAASLYPSIINVSGLGNTLIKATVTLTNLSHQNVSDVDALVVSPSTNTLIMAHVGSGTKATHLTLTFDDMATNSFSLPEFNSLTTGTNKSTQFYPVNNFP
jgi:hypothetical protein